MAREANASLPCNDSDLPERKERIQVRFRGSARNRIKDIAYIDVAEAIDVLGVASFPDTWGFGSIWKKMPFRKLPGRNGYFRYKLADQNGRVYLRTSRLKTDVSPDELSRCHDQYREKRDLLAQALYDAKIRAYKTYFDGRILPISSDQKALWMTQRTSVFYTGRASDEVPARRFQVLLDRSSFEHWANSPIKTIRSLSIARKRTLLTEIALSVAKNTKDEGYKPVKSATLKIVRDAFVIEGLSDISDNMFKAYCWSDESLASVRNGGPPNKELTAKRMEHQDKLIGLVRELVRSAVGTSPVTSDVDG